MQKVGLLGWTHFTTWIRCECGRQLRIEMRNTENRATCECGREYVASVMFNVMQVEQVDVNSR